MSSHLQGGEKRGLQRSFWKQSDRSSYGCIKTYICKGSLKEVYKDKMEGTHHVKSKLELELNIKLQERDGLSLWGPSTRSKRWRAFGWKNLICFLMSHIKSKEISEHICWSGLTFQQFWVWLVWTLGRIFFNHRDRLKKEPGFEWKGVGANSVVWQWGVFATTGRR